MHFITRDKRISHILIASILSVSWFAFGMAYFYFSSKPFSGFGLVLFIIYSLIIGAASGLLSMLLRVFNAIGNNSFLYRFIGTANIVLGLIGVFIILFAEMELTWLTLFVLCWVLGTFILQDTFRKPESSA